MRVERVELDGLRRAARRRAARARGTRCRSRPGSRSIARCCRPAARRRSTSSRTRLSLRDGAAGRSAGLDRAPARRDAHGRAGPADPPSAPIEIEGNSSVSDNVIRRQLTFRPGDIFRQSKLLESQRQLYALELFEFANVEPVASRRREAAEIPTRVTVTEGKHRKVNFGLGYGTEERARGEVDWRHVNFFGGARTAGVLARYSALDRGVRLNFKQPYFFSPRLLARRSGQSWHTTSRPSRSTPTAAGRRSRAQFGRAGGRVLGVAARRRRCRSPTRTSTRTTRSPTKRSRDPDVPRRADRARPRPAQRRRAAACARRSASTPAATRPTTCSTRGAATWPSVHLEQAGKWLGGDYDYYEVTAEGALLPVARQPRRAGRARARRLDRRPIGGDHDAERCRSTSATSSAARPTCAAGAASRSSPLSGSGLPIGGHTFMNFSTELRVPIWRQPRRRAVPRRRQRLDEPVGLQPERPALRRRPGLRYNTPIGPIRVDLGYQLNPIPGLLVNGKPEPRRFRFHFSIGQAF